MAAIKPQDTIQYHVTRPIEAVVDDGLGNYSVSPLGFPERDYGSQILQNPTKITPLVYVAYRSVLEKDPNIKIVYKELNENVDGLSGEKTLVRFKRNSVLNSDGTTATFTTVNSHGLTDGTIVNVKNAYNADLNVENAQITVIDDNNFSYPVSTSFVGEDEGSPRIEVVLSIGDYVRLGAQTNPDENGVYRIEENNWEIIELDSMMTYTIKAKTTENISLAGGLPAMSYAIERMEVDGKFVNVTTTEENGLATGSEVTISGADDSGYNGTFEIEKTGSRSFRYFWTTEPSTSPDTSASATVTYQIAEGDAIYVNSQDDESENGIYRAHDGSEWELIGSFYKFDGTENDNVAGNYDGEVDDEGNPIDHYRLGYSDSEVYDYLESKLDHPIRFAKFVGSNKDVSKNGPFIRWFLSKTKTNLGTGGVRTSPFVDAFALGEGSSGYTNDRTYFDINPANVRDLNKRKNELENSDKTAVWQIAASMYDTATGVVGKSAYLKDYPNKYNSSTDGEVAPIEVVGAPKKREVDENNWRMTITGTSTSSNPDARPLCEDMLWYQRDNGYHNNITLDMTSPSMFGKHDISIVQRLDTIDEVVADAVMFDFSTDVSGGKLVVSDEVESFQVGDIVTFAGGYPGGAGLGGEYVVSSRDETSIGISTLDGTVLALTTRNSTGSLRLCGYRKRYTTDVIDALESLVSVELNSGKELIRKVVSGNVTRYLWLPNRKNTFVTVTTGAWDPEAIVYENVSPNGIKVFLESTKSDYITFSHASKTSGELLGDLVDNNDMIPVLFDESVSDDDLVEIFATNSIYDGQDFQQLQTTTKNKKTFIHLPTPIDLKDGTKCSINVSIPSVPTDNPFGIATVGVLNSYRNYVTQPRAYVFTGYQKTVYTDLAVETVSRVNGGTKLEFDNEHGIFTIRLTDESIDTDTSEIICQDVSNISIGSRISFFAEDGATLPEGIEEGVEYAVSNVLGNRIRIVTVDNTEITISDAGSGEFGFVIMNGVKVNVCSDRRKWNGMHDAVITGKDSVLIKESLPIVSGNMKVSKFIIAEGKDGYEGLTERHNGNLFGSRPEVEFATNGSIFGQSFHEDDIIGNGKSGDEEDRRVCLATVYPTSTNTFAWRIDNDPELRLMKQSLMNTHNLGPESAVAVSYIRNRYIKERFSFVYDDEEGTYSKLDLRDVPVTYSTDSHYEAGVLDTMQFMNAIVRVWFPKSIVNVDEKEYDENSEYSYYGRQARKSYGSLVNDFLGGRIRRKANDGITEPNENSSFYSKFGDRGDQSTTFDLANTIKVCYDDRGEMAIPEHLYGNVIECTNYKTPYVYGGESDTYSKSNPYRWLTKAVYNSYDYVNASANSGNGSDDVIIDNAYRRADYSAMKEYMRSGYTSLYGDESNTDARNRFIEGDIVSEMDPMFSFYPTAEHPLAVAMKKALGDESALVLNDLNREFMDSAFDAAGPSRYLNVCFKLKQNTPQRQYGSFYGYSFVPFAKLLSTDTTYPTTVSLSLFGGNDPLLSETLSESIKSDPLLSVANSRGSIEAFPSINYSDDDKNVEEFIRDYVSGYSNRMPMRFYDSFRIIVHGTSSSSSYDTNVFSESPERTYKYALRDYLLNNIVSSTSETNELVGKYIDDNFAFDDSEERVAPGTVALEDCNMSSTQLNVEGTDYVGNVSVSALGHIIDRAYQLAKMKYVYTRINMSFVFSSDAGRWLLLDYKQAPTSYMTPTIGNAAFSVTEKSMLKAGTTGRSASDYIPVELVKKDINESMRYHRYENEDSEVDQNKVWLVPNDAEMKELLDVGTILMVENTKKELERVTVIEHGYYPANSTHDAYAVALKNNVKEYVQNDRIKVYYVENFIQEGLYPYDPEREVTNTARLFRYNGCNTEQDAYKDLECAPYYKMCPMEINKGVLPFLTNSFPYDNDGSRKPEFDPSIDVHANGATWFMKLLEPNKNVGFVVPNNVHGGLKGADEDLYLFQPNLWSVYWHMRPVVSAMEGTDIPWKDARTGGNMSDPVLNAMYSFPNMRSLEAMSDADRNGDFSVPLHTDMNIDWLRYETPIYVVDSEPGEDITRPDYYEIDSEIDGANENRDGYYEAEHLR